MKLVSRNLLVYGGIAAIVLLTFLFWSARSAWLASHEISDRQTERAFQNDNFLEDARARLLRINNLLLSYELSGSLTAPQRSEYRSLTQALKTNVETENEHVRQNKPSPLHDALIADFHRYFQQIDALPISFPTESAPHIPSVRSTRESAETIITTLNQISTQRALEIESLFSEYKASQARLYKLVLGLATLTLLLFGAAFFITLQNRVAKLRLDLTRSRLSQEKQEKLASLGILASGVAHEIRNPLTAIKARLFALDKRLEPESPAHDQIAGISHEISRLEKIVREFLLFARPPKPELEPFDVNALIQDIRDFLSDELEQRQLTLEILPGDAALAKGDAEQIRQILINLIQNAADASPPDSSIELKSINIESDGQNLVAIQVIDHGEGLPEEIAPKLFTPFFTTKPKGTGLGLSIAKRIAQTHKGDLRFQTRTEGGTTFELTLPLAP